MKIGRLNTIIKNMRAAFEQRDTRSFGECVRALGGLANSLHRSCYSKQYSAQERIALVLKVRELMAQGHGRNDACREVNIPKTTFILWNKKFTDGGAAALESQYDRCTGRPKSKLFRPKNAHSQTLR